MDKTSFEKPGSYSDYRRLYSQFKKNKRPGQKKIKIALLSSFTTQTLDEILWVKCFQQNIEAKIYLSPYNQYSQEILDGKSKLYAFNPDLIILFVDSRSFLGDYLLNPYAFSPILRRKFINNKLTELRSLINNLKKNSRAKILIHNFEVPYYSPFGILENKQQFGFQKSIKYLNETLQEVTLNEPDVFIFDYDLFCSKWGKGSVIDFKMYYLADLRLPIKYLAELCEEYLGYIKPLTSTLKKCLVLDLDNTLWGGILGEVGLKGIDLGPTPTGRSYWEFQKYILSLYRKGVLLAINSRNNLDEVLNVLEKHPYMVLKKEHFSSIKANWENKVTNMKSIAKELNIGLDSFLFIDDDPYNRELIRKNLKEISVVELPSDSSLYLDAITRLNEFNTLQLTKEDLERGKMYAQERKRHELENTASNIDDFVKNLGVRVKIEQANEFTIPRISQLTQKTNQFNMTTRRYLEDQIISFNSSDKYMVLAAKVEDRFGDYGLVGVLIVEKRGSEWVINNFLLSCRVLGRKVEESVFGYIISEAKKNKVKRITGEFIKTEKNAPAENFYKQSNFRLVKKLKKTEQWEFDFTTDYKFPKHVKIVAS